MSAPPRSAVPARARRATLGAGQRQTLTFRSPRKSAWKIMKSVLRENSILLYLENTRVYGVQAGNARQLMSSPQGIEEMLRFLQIEGKTLHQQEDGDWLYCGGLEPNLQHLRESTWVA
ncbi:uncharacterized protein RBU33_019382 [Hipposideros larvatus]